MTKFEAACKKLEDLGYTVIDSEISTTTAYAVSRNEIAIIDSCRNHLYTLSIKISNIPDFIAELNDIADMYCKK